MNYYDELAAMPDEILAIALQSWDETGRPRHENSYSLAIVNLLNLCNDWDEYKVRFKQLFAEADLSNPNTMDQVSMQWNCYIAGWILYNRRIYR